MKEVCEGRLRLAVIKSGYDIMYVFQIVLGFTEQKTGWMFRSTSGLLTPEEITKLAHFLDVDQDWLCGSGPTLPPFAEFER